MDPIKTKAVFDLSRNGTENYFRHPLFRSFVYTDGVKELAELGAYWLLDILGSEAVKAVQRDQLGRRGAVCLVELKVVGTEMDISVTTSDDAPACWTKHVDFTDFPEGEWTLAMQYDGKNVICLLLTEY